MWLNWMSWDGRVTCDYPDMCEVITKSLINQGRNKRFKEARVFGEMIHG